MLLPFPSNRRPETHPVVTWSLLSITAVVSLYQIGVSHNGSLPLPMHSLASVLGIVPIHFRPFTLITYTLPHANVGHLLVNLFYLWVFGAGVEGAVGHKRFLGIYVWGGAIGGALQLLVALRSPALQSPTVPIVGASAACAALIGSYAVRYYRDRIAFVGIPYRPTVVEVVTLFLSVEAALGIWEFFSGQPADGVAHWAHIGGFVAGLSAAYLLHLDTDAETAYQNEDAAEAMSVGRPGAALTNLEAILQRNPGDASARADVARAWRAFGDMEQASIHYAESIRLLLASNKRAEAANIYTEMRPAANDGTAFQIETPNATSRLVPGLAPTELYAVGLALEEMGNAEGAAEALRAVSMRAPASAEAETALVKVSRIYIGRLGRMEEARILLSLFMERYPNSPLRPNAEELIRRATTGISSDRKDPQ